MKRVSDLTPLDDFIEGFGYLPGPDGQRMSKMDVLSSQSDGVATPKVGGSAKRTPRMWLEKSRLAPPNLREQFCG